MENEPVNEPQAEPQGTPQDTPQDTSQDTPWINSDGTFGDLTKAPEEIRNVIGDKHKDVGSLAKSYRELEGFLGKRDKLVELPDENDPESMDKFYQKLGRPEKPDNYEFKPLEDDPEMDDSLLGLFKEAAFKDGLSQKNFENTVRFQLDAVKAMQQTAMEQQEAAKKAIRERFNSDDEYNQYTQKALGFAEQFKLGDDKSVADVIETKGLAHDPEILEMLGTLADSIEEDSLPNGGTKSTQTREQKLEAIKKNPAFTDASHPDHYNVIDEWRQLFIS